jgi:hypothetical protein
MLYQGASIKEQFAALRQRFLQQIPAPIRVVLVFTIWRLALSVVAGLSLWYNRALYPYGKLLSWNGSLLDRSRIVRRALIDGWSLWDSDYYTAIALHGYTFRNAEWPSIPFFPLYPALIRLILPLCGGDAALAGALVANTALVVALVLLYQLLRIDFGEALAVRTILVLLAFPMSLFFAANYTESLALALIVLAAWALRRQYWWLAGIAGFLLALTRLPGILVAPIILLIYLDHQQWRWRRIRWEALAATLPALGLLVFMAYQWYRFGTPLAFLQAQSQWEQHLSPPWAIPQTLIERLGNEWLAIYGLHLAIWGLFIILAIATWRKLPRLYALVLLLLVPAYLASWAFSIGRHVLIGFPAFVVLAIWSESRRVGWLLFGIMLPLLAICVALFVNTFWVG